jgi:hypothetical protein
MKPGSVSNFFKRSRAVAFGAEHDAVMEVVKRNAVAAVVEPDVATAVEADGGDEEDDAALVERFRQEYPANKYRLSKDGFVLRQLAGKTGKNGWRRMCACHRMYQNCTIHGKVHCKHRKPWGLCPDPTCNNGDALCTHKKPKSRCLDVACGGGGSYCMHRIFRSICPDPQCGGGKAWCVTHIQPKRLCPDPQCGGGNSLCAGHGLEKCRCPDPQCGGGASICTHGIMKTRCPDIECGGGSGLCACGKHIAKDGYCTKCHPDYVEQMRGFSIIACKFIGALESQLGIPIQHIRYDAEQKVVSGQEHRPDGWKKKAVDGYYQEADGTKVAIEFLGDYYHGHPSQWGGTVFGRPCKDMFTKTEEKLQKLSSLGYRVMYVWEYDYPRKKVMENVQSILREFNGTLEY